MIKTNTEAPSVNYTNRFGITFQSVYSITENRYDTRFIRITCPNCVPVDVYHHSTFLHQQEKSKRSVGQ